MRKIERNEKILQKRYNPSSFEEDQHAKTSQTFV